MRTRRLRVLGPILVVGIVSSLFTVGMLAAPTPAVAGESACGPMDVAFVMDDTGSMLNAIDIVQVEAASIIATISNSSGGDFQLSLVTFKDTIDVDDDLASGNEVEVGDDILALEATGGDELPEASDEALNTVINGLDADERPPGAQRGDFDGAFRDEALKIIILITDALPAGFNDAYDPGIDDVNAHTRALEAAAADIKIAAVFVPTDGDPTGDITRIMQDYATVSDGGFLQTEEDGKGTGRAIDKILEVSCRQTTVTWSFGPTLPFEATRWDGAYVAFQKRVYFLGFRTTGDATDGSVWYFDVDSGNYVDTGVDMPEPISNYQIAALQDSTGLGLYIFGGRNANAEIVDTVQVYYPTTNTASIIGTDPWPGRTQQGCVSLPAMGVATVKNRAVVMGGVNFTANGCLDDNSDETWIYSPNAPAGSRWSQGPDLNLARGYITPAVLGGKVYAIGGDINVAGTLIPQVTVESLDVTGSAWDDGAVADLPAACDESQTFAPPTGPLAGNIVLAGCGQWPNALPDVYIYDESSDAWSLASSLNEARRNQAGTFVKLQHSTKMFVLGGYAADGITPLTSTELGIGSVIARPGFARPGPNEATGNPTTS